MPGPMVDAVSTVHTSSERTDVMHEVPTIFMLRAHSDANTQHSKGVNKDC